MMKLVMPNILPNARVRQDGWWYPWLFVAAFGVVIAVNGVMIWYALTSWTGLETKDHFKEGLAYNDILTERRVQRNLGWQAELAFSPAPSADAANAGQAILRMQGETGPIDGLSVSGLVMRPTQDGMDQTVSFQPRGEGLYVARVQVPLPGQWELRIEAQRGEDVFKLRKRIQVP